MSKSGVDRAAEAAGGTGKLAELLGITDQAVSNARRRGFLSPGNARRVADQYGIPYLDLVSPKVASAIRASY